jgi:hypothetical protein
MSKEEISIPEEIDHKSKVFLEAVLAEEPQFLRALPKHEARN